MISAPSLGVLIMLQYMLISLLLTCCSAAGLIRSNDKISDGGDEQDLNNMSWAKLSDLADEDESSFVSEPRVRFNVLTEGAVGDGVTNDTHAFLSAWTKACQANHSVVFVPARYNYLVYPSTYSGPCQGDIQFQVEGMILAPLQRSAWDHQSVNYWILFINLSGFGLLGKGTFNGRGQEWWTCRNNGTCPRAPTAVSIYRSSNVSVKSISIIDSPQIHINFQYITLGIVRGITIQAPTDSPNTDGIHLAYTTNFAIQECNVSTGDDCVSIVSGSHNIVVQNTYCGIGCHGISVGSLGANGVAANVSQVLVKNCHMESTTNGVRIKTWQGGLGMARNFQFENIRMTNVSNPIIIDQFYCPPSQSGPCTNRSTAVGISLVKYMNISGTSATSTAVNLACSEVMPCMDIRLTDINITRLNGRLAGSACINAFGVAAGLQAPPNCLATQSLSIFTPLTLYLTNFDAIWNQLRGILAFYT